MVRQSEIAEPAIFNAAIFRRVEALGALAATFGAAQPPGWQGAVVGEYVRSFTLRQADLR
jgi:hypothetical protein